MNITIFTVGKIKESYFRDAIREYQKRLSKYCNLRIVEVTDEKTPDHASEALEESIRAKEGERLLKQIPDRTRLIALAIDGKRYTSEGLAEHIRSLTTYGTSDISFVIGGSLGLSKEVMNRADETLSFSDFTFPHQLMRVILLEQIYRSFRIMNGEPYHK